MENLSHSRKPNKGASQATATLNNRTTARNGATNFSGKTMYDGVFGGPTLSPRPEDYTEIFGGFHAARGAAIPVLDLPLLDNSDGAMFDVRNPRFNYAEVFGGFDASDFAASYEQLMRQANGSDHQDYDGDSSDDAWMQADTETLSEGSDHSRDSRYFSNGDYYEPIESNMEFNISYHKANLRSNRDMSNGVTHVAELQADSEYAYIIETPLEKTESKDPRLHMTDDIDLEFTGGVAKRKHLRKTVPHPSNCAAGEQTFTNDSTQRRYQRSDSCSNEMFVTIDEINLRTLPSDVPPPSRPPPPADVKNRGYQSVQQAASGGRTGDSSPPFYDVEIDASSAAVASASAMREAMDKAQAKLKSAKELLERKREDIENSTKPGSKSDGKSKKERASKAIDGSSDIKDDKVQGMKGKEDSGMKMSVREERQKAVKTPAPDSLEGEKLFNAPKRFVVEKHGKECQPIQEFDEIDGADEWQEEAQFFELVRTDKSRMGFEQTNNEKVFVQSMKFPELQHKSEKASIGAYEQLKSEKKVEAVREDHELEKVERDMKTAKEAKEASRRKGHEKKVKSAQEENGQSIAVQKPLENGKKPTGAVELGKCEKPVNAQEKENKVEVWQAMEQKEKEQQEKETSKSIENPKRVKGCQERVDDKKSWSEVSKQEKNEIKLEQVLLQAENEMMLREAAEQEEKEKILKEACEREENEMKEKEAREGEDDEKRLKEALEREANEKRLKEAREREEDEKRLKEAREREEDEKRLKEAREREENEKRLKEACEREENEKKEKQACEREENEKKEKAREREENDKKEEEAHELEESERIWRLALEQIENEKRLKHARLQEENVRRQRKALVPEEMEKKQREARETDENRRRPKQVTEQGKDERKQREVIGREEAENKLKEACEKEAIDKGLEEAREKIETAKRLEEACEKENIERMFEEAVEQNDYSKVVKVVQDTEDGVHQKVVEQEETEKLQGVNCAYQQTARGENGKKERIAGETHQHGEGEDLVVSDEVNKMDYIKKCQENQVVGNNAQNCDALEETEESIGSGKMEAEFTDSGRKLEAMGQCGVDGKFNVSGTIPYHQNNGVKKAAESVIGIRVRNAENVNSVLGMDSNNDKQGLKFAYGWRERERNIKDAQVSSSLEENRDKYVSAQSVKESVETRRKPEATKATVLEGKGSTQRTVHQVKLNQSMESKDKSIYERLTPEEKEAGRLKRERELESERLRKIEEEREREREREKDRMAVDRKVLEAREWGYAEARERAEKAAVERATAESRQRAMAEARDRLEKACAEAREKSSMEARLRAERAAVERATAEARERAVEKIMAERAAFEARERVERSMSDKFSASSRNSGMRTGTSSSDLKDQHFQRTSSFGGLRYPYASSYNGAEGESAQRCKARLERYQRTAERAAKALEEKNMRDLLAQREQAERNRLAETLDADVKRWSSGKEGNLRALLSTLQYILGPDSGWQPIPLTEVITSAAVKKAYRKATLCVHPDKLQQRGASIHQKYICEKVFDLLKEAWNKFNSEER
ncbi:AUXILIN-LIKE4 [Hibiscus trionum]|uniref:AUXILIN-LIKE4 n=1 Tax=Hibiscus trionum TaxID=183268 RepID=A0A9W7H0D9_HIBTR|nr:AUXILIN-LIKE4 [Hibiscus trionum]